MVEDFKEKVAQAEAKAKKRQSELEAKILRYRNELEAHNVELYEAKLNLEAKDAELFQAKDELNDVRSQLKAGNKGAAKTQADLEAARKLLEVKIYTQDEYDEGFDNDFQKARRFAFHANPTINWDEAEEWSMDPNDSHLHMAHPTETAFLARQVEAKARAEKEAEEREREEAKKREFEMTLTQPASCSASAEASKSPSTTA
ncbi:uncharacterized protein LOC110696732 [Chenopodium quinoa]|uniref:uncharacterized protein LOC110696732 n=1 Tax=Chenopodium quinoa TaxID=63459 RepID=UPI000B7916B6|nr:uncharacterized protein LOC110696732 [Chenopodium quinoa]